MLSNQWLTKIAPPACSLCIPAKNAGIPVLYKKINNVPLYPLYPQKNGIEDTLAGKKKFEFAKAATDASNEDAEKLHAVRCHHRMRRAGFTVRLMDNELQVAPADRLSAEQLATIREHKPALVALLQDAETLHAALVQAGPAGLGWQDEMPGWDDARRLAAGEVLYADRRMMSRDGRRYLRERAP
ncbi:MAG: hypothetical protein WAV07_09080 [Candidatus Contendobacter sp.]